MAFFDNLALGFGVALTASHLLYCLLGVTLGSFIGVLPGLGPLVTISMLLPITFNLEPTSALIMLAGIYYGASYGGSTTAILVNLPGESSSVVTCLDGHAMAKQGRAGPALAIAALSSFFAGTVATALIALFAPPLAGWALSFGSPEYFSLMLVGLLTAAALAHGSMLKSMAMVVLGLVLGTIGTDVNSGLYRLTFGVPELSDGLSFVVIAMGMFGIAEIVANLEQGTAREVFTGKVRNLMPSRRDIADSWRAVLRGTGIGSFLGILPGAGTTISSFLAYAMEKRFARDPSRFGTGAIEGVAAPEAANNAAAQTAFIPTLTLGIPGSGTMALVLGALTIYGIDPGPRVMTSHPDLFWGLVVSMWIGNLMLVILNLPLIGIWVRMLRVPYRLLYPSIVVLCCVGVYTLAFSYLDVVFMAVSGVAGYVLVKLECEPAPLLLGFVLGPMMEENLRRSMVLSRGDPSIFVTQPISLGLLVFAAILLALLVVPAIRDKRAAAVSEGEH
ncbi:MAG: tripartite tricarboxylate transporter permease [Alphaproteobacteria bacterium]|nr:tripartite tricarboxylate transporter permease [Alphaproteobacteria bacterium]